MRSNSGEIGLFPNPSKAEPSTYRAAEHGPGKMRIKVSIMKHLFLERGKPYPLPLATQEGTSVQFLMRQSSILQVRFRKMGVRRNFI